MKVLIVGSGGREHALTWKLAKDRAAPDLYCAPGNAGTAELATTVDIRAEDVDGLVAWVRKEKPDLTVVGPEAPLCAGLADALAADGFCVFGPSRMAARLEGSKIFAKEVMESAGVPTASARIFSDAESALKYLDEAQFPVVVKADGLAAGKGVSVCGSGEEAERAVREAMIDARFGESGSRILIEDCLAGPEASVLALVDGERVVMLASSQDHKRAFDGDAGPNTGGMGAYSPTPAIPEDMWPRIEEEVFSRTLRELKRRDIVYRGVLYAGLMMTDDGPRVLEFNCRFGDPETQAILPRFKGDLFPVLSACAEGRLSPDMVQWRSEACVCVVLASRGYPGHYEKGKPIQGLAAAGEKPGVAVFHAGTRKEGEQVVTAGGRVLGVTALGSDLKQALGRAYEAVDCIEFDGKQYRADIAHKAL